MPAICRVGDTNTVGGELTRGTTTVFLDGKPIALHPSPITPHSPWQRNPHYPGHHHDAVTTEGLENVVVEGSQPVFKGAGTTCGHPISTASESTAGS